MKHSQEDIERAFRCYLMSYTMTGSGAAQGNTKFADVVMLSQGDSLASAALALGVQDAKSPQPVALTLGDFWDVMQGALDPGP